MKLSISERAVTRQEMSDVDYIKTILRFQKDNLKWMSDSIGSALASIDDAEARIDSGDFGYDDWGRTPDDDEYFPPEDKSVDEALADLYDYDKTQEMYYAVSDYCRNIKDSIDVLRNVVINKED